MKRKRDDEDDSFNDFKNAHKQNPRALYVRPPQRSIDFNTIPADGNEFIHKARLENSFLDFSKSDTESVSDSSQSWSYQRMSKSHLRKSAADFARLANEMKSFREYLKVSFPQSYIIPCGNEIESCLFCLGSSKCSRIYDCGTLSFADAHMPFISIVIHLNQSEVQTLLRYTLKWYKTIGMCDDIGRWVYALFACINKPLTDIQESFLLKYFDDLKIHLEICDEEEYDRVRFLMSLLEIYFVLKNNPHDGKYLEQLLRLSS